MLDLTFTPAVRRWVADREAVEFTGQWEATRYRFYVTRDALEQIEALSFPVNDSSAEKVFDENQGILLPAAHRLWLASNKAQEEFVITTEEIKALRDEQPGLFEG
ncbi:DUF1488 family protein [Novosphingobium sp.]|jgi:hypothetical protein|uniref:DUF1488 family protein n=1 Tax=Novosphingobium sp. TaxID=1874826 RepID=UPI002FE05907